MPLGDIDGSGTFLGDFLVDALNPKSFEATRADESQDVRCEARQLSGSAGDEVEVLFRPGERGLRADHLEPGGQVAFKQTAQHTQLFTCGSVFRLPRKAEVGLWACHSINRRGPKSLVAPELERLFRERFDNLRLTFKPSVNAAAFRDALENDRLLEATLIAFERSPDIADEEAWVDKDTGLKLRLDIEPSGGKRLFAGRVLKAFESRDLGDIVEFGGVKFDSANFKVKLANGTDLQGGGPGERLCDLRGNPARSGDGRIAQIRKPVRRARAGIDRVEMKANPWKLIQQHYRTLRDYRTDEVRKRDWALLVGAPIVVFVVCLVLNLHLPKGASTGLLTTAGVLTAFFFGVMLQIAGRALEWADERPPVGRETSWQAQFLQEIAANAGYAALVSILAAAVFVGSLIATGSTALTVLSSLGVALAFHLALMLSMVLTRVYALTANRLTDARVGGPSGGSVTPLPERKTGT